MRWLVSSALLHQWPLCLRSMRDKQRAMAIAAAALLGTREATGGQPRMPSSGTSWRSTAPRTGTSSPTNSTADQVKP